MSSALDLVVLNGPHESEVVQLKPHGTLRIGRSSKGFQLVDPLVSLSHAEVMWEGDRYWIEDLGSATGTFVNDVRLTDKAICLVPGMRVRFGETVVEVRPRPKSALLRIVGAISAVFLLSVAVSSIMRGIEVEYEPRVQWYQPVNQGGGYASKIIEIPMAFIRRTGADHRSVKIDKVTDYDGDGIDELWLRWPTGREIDTFDGESGWKLVSDIPMSCDERVRRLAEGLPAECYVDRNAVKSELPEVCRAGVDDGGFPDLDCAGVTYRFRDGGYAISGIEGPVVWMPQTVEVEDPARSSKKVKAFRRDLVEGPPEPYIFTLTRAETLAGFLSDRGVYQPVHYLICEYAFEGLKAQVLTASGDIMVLEPGCIGDLDIVGVTRNADFGDFGPHMVAFTGVGYNALLDDMATWMGGGTDMMFMSRRDRKIFAKLASEPKRRLGSILLEFEGPEFLTGSAAEEIPLEGPRRLLPTEFAPESPPFTQEFIVTGSGRYDIEGCGELDIRAQDWHCLRTKGCTANSTFLRVRNVGCGKKLPYVNIPYADGTHAYRDGLYTGKVRVETAGQGQLDVLRVRFSYLVPEDAQ